MGFGLLVCNLLLTCKRDWDSAGGHRRDFVVGCPLAVAAVLSCKVQHDWWIAPHLAVRTLFLIAVDGFLRLLSLSCVLSFGLPLGCLLLIKVGAPSLLKFRWSGKCMMSVCSICLGRMLYSWMSPLMQVMSLVFGSWPGGAVFRVVKLGVTRFGRPGCTAADALDAADVFLYRDYSIAPLIRSGVSLSRSVELTAQWDKIWAVGPLLMVLVRRFTG